MKFKLTVQYPDGTKGCEWHDLVTLRQELAQIANVLDALVPGETVTIERIS